MIYDNWLFKLYIKREIWKTDHSLRNLEDVVPSQKRLLPESLIPLTVRESKQCVYLIPPATIRRKQEIEERDESR